MVGVSAGRKPRMCCCTSSLELCATCGPIRGGGVRQEDGREGRRGREGGRGERRRGREGGSDEREESQHTSRSQLASCSPSSASLSSCLPRSSQRGGVRRRLRRRLRHAGDAARAQGPLEQPVAPLVLQPIRRRPAARLREIRRDGEREQLLQRRRRDGHLLPDALLALPAHRDAAERHAQHGQRRDPAARRHEGASHQGGERHRDALPRQRHRRVRSDRLGSLGAMADHRHVVAGVGAGHLRQRVAQVRPRPPPDVERRADRRGGDPQLERVGPRLHGADAVDGARAPTARKVGLLRPPRVLHGVQHDERLAVVHLLGAAAERRLGALVAARAYPSVYIGPNPKYPYERTPGFVAGEISEARRLRANLGLQVDVVAYTWYDLFGPATNPRGTR